MSATPALAPPDKPKEKSPGTRIQQLGKAVLGGILVMIPGALGLVSGMFWLFPSLGPSYFMQVQTPQLKAAQPFNVVGGHLIGVGAGYLAVLALGGLSGIPSALSAHRLLTVHVVASGLAIGLMILVQLLAKAEHPPAAATVLLITLGGFRVAWPDLSWLLVGIAIMAITGEVARRWIVTRTKPEPAV
jgi:CBS-domain-containing membrane protein